MAAQPVGQTAAATFIATAGVTLVIFLFAIDATIVSSAMPTVVAKLGGIELYSWVFSIYMLASALVTPIFGKLSDLFSRRRLILVGLAVFLLGSVLCGLAQSMLQLVIFRAVQGIGGGIIYSLSFIIIGVVFPPEKRGAMQGMVGAVWGVASVLGPLAGGVIAQYWNWHWIFFINLPTGALAASLIAYGFREGELQRRRPSLDVKGGVALSVGLLALLLALMRSGESARPFTPAILSMFGFALATLILFLGIERRAAEPLLPLGLFRLRLYSTSVMLAMLASMGAFGIIGYLPLYVQGVWGGSAAKAGLLLLPVSIGWSSGSLLVGHSINRFGYRTICFTGMACMVIGYALFIGTGSMAGKTAVLIDTFLIGVGTGMVITTSLVSAQTAVPTRQLGVATSTIMLIRTFGGALCISIMGSVLFSSMHSQIVRLSNNSGISLAPETIARLANPQNLLRASSRVSLPEQLLPALTQALSHSLGYAFLTGLVATFLGAALSITMAPYPDRHAAPDESC